MLWQPEGLDPLSQDRLLSAVCLKLKKERKVSTLCAGSVISGVSAWVEKWCMLCCLVQETKLKVSLTQQLHSKGFCRAAARWAQAFPVLLTGNVSIPNVCRKNYHSGSSVGGVGGHTVDITKWGVSSEMHCWVCRHLQLLVVGLSVYVSSSITENLLRWVEIRWLTTEFNSIWFI